MTRGVLTSIMKIKLSLCCSTHIPMVNSVVNHEKWHQVVSLRNLRKFPTRAENDKVPNGLRRKFVPYLHATFIDRRKLFKMAAARGKTTKNEEQHGFLLYFPFHNWCESPLCHGLPYRKQFTEENVYGILSHTMVTHTTFRFCPVSLSWGL